MGYRRRFYEPHIEVAPGVILPPGVQVLPAAAPVPDAPAVETPTSDPGEPVPAVPLMLSEHHRPGMWLHVEDVAGILNQMARERPEWAEPLELAAAGFLQPQIIE